MISPSAGMNSPASTSTTSPLRRRGAATVSSVPSGALALGHGLGLRLAQRVGLRLAAAFGHRFGEVGEQHRQPEPERDLQLEAELAAAGAASCTSRTVVSTLPTSTTNITGFCAIVRGCSLRERVDDRARGRCADPRSIALRVRARHQNTCPLRHQQVLDDRAEAEGREERQRADDHDDADQQRREQRRRHRERARATAARASCGRGCRRSPASG